MESFNSLEQFKSLVDELTLEYEEYISRYSNGLTCEFSTSSEDFEEKVDYLMKKRVKMGRWSIFKCKTCEEYDSEAPWHVEIENSLSFEEQHQEIGKLWLKNLDLERYSQGLLKQIKGKEYYPKGVLSDLVKLFEDTTEAPQEFEEYLRATYACDHAKGLNRSEEGSEDYKFHAQALEDVMKPAVQEVLWSSDVNVTLDEDGNSRWNMFSDINGGCCAYAHLTGFDYRAGQRLKITIGVLEK